MPNRIIKESINESRGLADCSFFTQDLFKKLITYADDYGRFNADTQIMLARLYPRETDVILHDDVITSLIELCGVGKIAFYTSTARKEIFGCFPNWYDHQRIRDSKKKCPDPTDTSINDWYYRRFIPIDMKIRILERDNCRCKICNKDLNTEKVAIKRLIKMYLNSVHFDHIIPCNQGGRATFENLQTTCPKCNLTRKKFYSFDEILLFSVEGCELQESAASCGEFPPNPIQSNPNPNPIPIQTKSIYTDEFELFYSEYPRSENKSQTFNNWKSQLKKGLTPEVLIQAAKKYKAKCIADKKDKDYCYNSSNFLGKANYVEDYIDGGEITGKNQQPTGEVQAENKYAAAKSSKYFS